MTTENKLVIICSDESKWKWHSATTIKNKPNTIIDGSCIHCAVEQLKAELAYYKNGTQIKEIHYDEPALYATEIAALKSKLAKVKKDLTAVLYDPDGNVSIGGSHEDNIIIETALKEMGEL